MHVKEARWLDLTIIQVVRPQASDRERDRQQSVGLCIKEKSQKGLWAWWLCSMSCGVLQEHGYRFDKQALLWTEARLRTPEQFDRWSPRGSHRAQPSRVSTRFG